MKRKAHARKKEKQNKIANCIYQKTYREKPQDKLKLEIASKSFEVQDTLR